MNPATGNLEKDGFSIHHGIFTPGELDILEDASAKIEESSKEKGGGRNILQCYPDLLKLFKRSSVISVFSKGIGNRIGISEGIFLNKKDDANWLVAWHQDVFICVRKKVPSEGFTSWTLKHGMPYVQPPAEVLQKSVWVRLNLDANDEDNGCLRVVPGSHLLGKIPADSISSIVERHGELALPCSRGEAIMFNPLLLHASSKSARPSQRRVFQVLYSGYQFKNGLEWPY